MPSQRVPGFLPSTSGFHFPNWFPEEPVLEISLGVVTVPLGDAAHGLCGGMAFAARDYYEARLQPPPDTIPPARDTPLFKFIAHRLVESFALPGGPLKYLELMSPLLSDGETFASRAGFAPHGRAWRMIVAEWPKIQADLDSGHPAPLGLVKTISFDPRRLGVNHQVLAYGYDLDGEALTLHLYDPNYPDNDQVTLSLSLADPTRATPISYFPTDALSPAIYCFFRSEYRAPWPGLLAGGGG